MNKTEATNQWKVLPQDARWHACADVWIEIDDQQGEMCVKCEYF